MTTLDFILFRMTEAQLAFFFVAHNKHLENRTPDEIEFLATLAKLISN